MIERVLIALAIIGGLAVAGVVIRAAARRWYQCRFSGLTLSPDEITLPRVITFSSQGCAECRTQRRIIEAVLAEWAGGIDVTYVDAVEEPALARRFGVLLVPTTVVTARDGRIVGINGGLADADRLLSQLCTAAA